MQKLIE